jgi:hypothetical protein
MNSTPRNLLYWAVAALVIFLFWSVSARIQKEERLLSFSDFMSQLERGHVRRVTFTGNSIGGEFANGRAFRTYVPLQAEGVVDLLLEKGVEVNARDAGTSSWSQSLVNWFPILIMIAFLMLFGRLSRGTPDVAIMNRVWEALAASDRDLSLDEIASGLRLRPNVKLKAALFQMLREQTIFFTSEKKYRVKTVP